MHEKGIETFLAIAMSRTLGKAAELLNVTQSTISYNLSELESEMGMILVDRQKGMKSVRLTPAGESFLPLALKWQEVSREIGNARNPGSAYSLSIGGSDYVIGRLLPEVFRELLNHEPPVYLKIFTDPADRLYEAVESRALDAAIVIAEEVSRYVQVEQVYRENYVVIRIPENRGEESLYLHPSELRQENEFYIEWNGGFRLWHDHLWDPAKSFRVKLDSVKLLPSLMTRPGQWCIVPESSEDLFRSECPSAVVQNMTDYPPDLVYYKITHRYPKAGSVPALTIFDEVLRDRMPRAENVKECVK